MRTLFICLLTIFMISCNGKSAVRNVEPIKPDTIRVVEFIYVEDSIRILELNKEIDILRDSLELVTAKINYEDYINARRIEKIKYYITITDRKPSNKKFFFGWIKRTMSEE